MAMLWRNAMLVVGVVAAMTSHGGLVKEADSSGSSSGECTNPVMRREIRELTFEEVQRYIAAAKKLSAPDNDVLGTQFTRVHIDNVRWAHGVPAFYPWHRYFSRRYEMALQAIDPSVTLPYWDWTLDAAHPERSIVFSADYFGGSGTAATEYCVTGTHFNRDAWQVYQPKPHCLKRQFDQGNDDRIKPFYSREALEIILRSGQTYQEFHEAIELGPHGSVHDSVGGRHGELGFMHSPNDPLFFIHHGFVDLLYVEWQRRNPHLAHDYGGRANYSNWDGPTEFTIEDELVPFNIKVKDQLDIDSPFYCYTYPRWNAPLPPLLEGIIATKNASMMEDWSLTIPGAIDSLNQAEGLPPAEQTRRKRQAPPNRPPLPVPDQLSEEFLVKNHLNLTRSQNLHNTLAKLINLINSLPPS